MKVLTVIFLGLICVMPAQAKIAENHCITHIHDIMEIIQKLHGETLAAIDWDQTISKNEGEYDLRETGDRGTLATIKAIQDKGIKTMILTARIKGLGKSGGMYAGDHYSGKEVVDTVEKNDVPKMLKVLGNDWKQHGPLKANDLEDMHVQGKLSNSGKRKLYAITKDQIVFAGGGTIKGETLAQLIDENKFVAKPDNILFIDNDEDNTINIEHVFQDRPENVYIFRYPDPPEDKPCPKK